MFGINWAGMLIDGARKRDDGVRDDGEQSNLGK